MLKLVQLHVHDVIWTWLVFIMLYYRASLL